MTSRIPKSPDTVRCHVQMPPEWLRLIDRAARTSNMSRSSYIARAAYNAAKAILGAVAPTPDVPRRRVVRPINAREEAMLAARGVTFR
jgi:hypothetical protein